MLAQYLGWRSTFWFLVIFAGVLLLLFVGLFPETCRAVVGNGGIPARGVDRSLFSYLVERRRRRQQQRGDVDHANGGIGGEENAVSGPPYKKKWQFPNPLYTLRILGEKESCIILLYNGLFFTGMMVVSAAIPDLFLQAYGLDELKVGLCYISMGTGCLFSAMTTG